MGQGYTIGSDASFRRLNQAVEWVLRRIDQERLGGGDEFTDIPTITVMITNSTPDAEGMFDAKFVIRDVSVIPHTWKDLSEDAICKVDVGLIDNCLGSGGSGSGSGGSGSGGVNVSLGEGCVYQGYVTGHTDDGVPIVLITGGAGGGDRVSIIEPYYTGLTPPKPKLFYARRMIYNFDADDFDPSYTILARDANG